MEERNQNNWSDCKKFYMIISGSFTYFLKVGARFSLDVVTKACFSGKKIFKNLDFQYTFLKRKRRSVTKKIEVCAIGLPSL